MAEIKDVMAGRLTLLSPVGRDKFRHLLINCRCTCGRMVVVRADYLLSGHTTSCGCYSRELAKDRCTKGFSGQGDGRPPKHGEADKTPEYAAWHSMKQRCLNPKDRRYKDYGGRGITIFPAWKESYEAFLADMGRRPSNKHSLERVNNNGNYEPENCKWATAKEQCANRRKPNAN